MNGQLTIDAETADRITVDNLKAVVEDMKNDVDKIIKEIGTGDAYPTRHEDLAYNLRFIDAAKTVLQYYGE